MAGENEGSNRTLNVPWTGPAASTGYSRKKTPFAYRQYTPEDIFRDGLNSPTGATTNNVGDWYFNPLVSGAAPGDHGMTQIYNPDGSLVDYDNTLGDKASADAMKAWGLAAAGLTAGLGSAVAGGLGAAEGAGAADAAWGINPSLDGAGGALASDAGFVPGSFDLGASGYGGTAASGLDTAAGYSAGANAAGFAPGGGRSTGYQSAIGKLLGLTPEQSLMLDIGGKAVSTGMGLMGNKAQADAYRDVANQQMQLGANDRARLDASYGKDFNIWDQPGYGNLLKGVTDTQLNRLSAKGGNPFGNPSGLAAMNQSIMNNVGLPALANYRGQLMTGGGVGLNNAAAASLHGAGTQRTAYDVLSAGIGSMTTPQTSESELMDLIRKAGGQTLQLNRGNYT